MNRQLKIKQILDNKIKRFDYTDFISNNLIGVVYKMKNKPNATPQDVEICAILTAIIAFKDTVSTINKAMYIMDRCSWEPYKWIMNKDFLGIDDNEKIYLLINGKILKDICMDIYNVYSNGMSLMDIAKTSYNEGGHKIENVINALSKTLKSASLGNTYHSPCKRLCQFLNWMVRTNRPCLGIWTFINQSELYPALDSKTVKQSIKLGLVDYKRASWKSMLQLTGILRSWDEEDPLKYCMVLNSLNKKSIKLN